MARILLIGGHGKVALLLAPLLVRRGDTVTSVIRNPEHEADVAATSPREARAAFRAMFPSDRVKAVTLPRGNGRFV